MNSSRGILRRITHAFWLQIGLITLAAILGVFIAKIVIEETLVKNALKYEAEYFWKHYNGDTGIPLPDTSNLTGYFDPDQLPPPLRQKLPAEPGFYEYSTLSNRIVLHVSESLGKTLYLVYYRGQVDALILYYGLLPLLAVLVILYLTLWMAYRVSRYTLSPIARLADQINEIDLSRNDLELDLKDPGLRNNDEIQVLSEALSHLGDRLKSAMARERNFTRNASHELRTPLTIINVAADMMLIEQELPHKAHQSLLKIKRAVYDMENLTEVFLMLAREDAVPAMEHVVSVNEVVRGQIDRVAFLRENKAIQLRLNETADLRIRSSETVVAVLIGNLIRNAILHIERGEVVVDIEAHSIAISDNGPGIAESKIDSIFEPFDRADVDSGVDGYGVGLTIVKRLCERFGWRIDVDSITDHGTCFKIDFGTIAAQP